MVFTRIKTALRHHENPNCVSTIDLKWQFITKPQHIGVFLCHLYPNDEDLNICGKSRMPIRCLSANIKFVSQWHCAVSVAIADLRGNRTLRHNNSQSWCYWLYWSILMTMVAISGTLMASPNAMGCRCRCWASDWRCIARAADMVINVACGPMANKTQILACG